MDEGADSDFPSELSRKLSDFHRSLESVETVLDPLLSGSLANICEKNNALDRAKLDLVAAYSLNSLFWIYLNIKGESSQDHGINQELERIQSYIVNVSAILDKKNAPRLDPNLAKRFVRNALWKPKEKTQAGKGVNEETSMDCPVEKGETSNAGDESSPRSNELKMKHKVSQKRSREARQAEKKKKNLQSTE